MEYVDELTRLLGKAFLHRFTCIHILRICIVLYNKYHVVQSILGIENPPPRSCSLLQVSINKTR